MRRSSPSIALRIVNGLSRIDVVQTGTTSYFIPGALRAGNTHTDVQDS